MTAPARTLDRSRLGSALRRVLPNRVEIVPGGTEQTASILTSGDRLRAQWIGEGRLSTIRDIVAESDAPEIVVGRVLSPGARAALSEAGIGWVDETGAAEIATDSIIISRTGRPLAPRERAARWTPAVLAVAEALLCDTRPTVAAAADATGLSDGACSNALRTLTTLGLLHANAARGRDSARAVVDTDAFLDAYASAVSAAGPGIALALGVTWQDPIDGLARIGRDLDRLAVPWAATGFVASDVRAPLITTIGSAEVYVEAARLSGLEIIAADLGLRAIEGGRLTLRPFPTRASSRLLSREGNLNIVPWPRLYADLREQGVRGEDAAEHLRETIQRR